jgi:hypothetical protein
MAHVDHVMQLRKKNKELQLFWKTHRKSNLQQLMKKANNNSNDPSAPKCTCLSCTVAGRLDKKVAKALPWGAPCTFKPWFEQLLAEHGLTCAVGVPDGMESLEPHMSDDCQNGVYDVDAHFHHLTRDDWFTWMYGAKLWKAKSADDPELQKLRRLFEAMEATFL